MPFPFTNPFRYSPHPLVKKAAAEVMDRLAKRIKEDDGKMLGVLVCQPADNSNVEQICHLHKLDCNSPEKQLYYLAAFSGTVHDDNGCVTATVEGFVPPIIDLTDPEGYFKRKEAEISQINKQFAQLSSSTRLQELKSSLTEAQEKRDSEIQDMQTRISFSKMRRDEIRTETADSNVLNELIKESQFQKAELKRIKDKWKQAISEIDSEIQQVQNKISELKTLRARMSDNLQKWIFENALVHNAHGESTTIWDLFQNQGLTPPGGTGDCAAPKLLEYAYKNGLRPLAMGEFWYGKSPETAVRTHGHFYPSCTSKCGPLLGYMTMGLNVQEDIKITSQAPIIIDEDESIIVVEKPSGMPSVPGLDGRPSLEEWLSNHADHRREVVAVHRLDMDTSGVMIFAKTRDAEINLKKQFEEHTVRKTYIARLTGRPPQSADLESPEAQGIRHDSINLPLSADYDERPRQKVDFKQGKPAYTEYEIVKENPDGTADILLHPHTGRTHQLRVHCAHVLGLNSPIMGDLLYGGHSAYNKEGRNVNRLCLHALSINFLHPVSNSPMEFISEKLTFSLEE